ncbi:hypothetical protein D3C80_384710 [compost metagenome]
MHTKAVLDLSEVTRILAAARAEADANQWKVAIAVVDDGGHPLALERLDGCAPISARESPHRRPRPSRIEGL